jgi:uncharacterized alkaline shock family protein YloU
MRLFKNLSVFVFMVLLVGAGSIILALSFALLPLDHFTGFVQTVQQDQTYQWTAAVIGGMFLLLGICIPLRAFGTINRSKYISFQNPDGEVTVSVMAIEEYVRKVARNIPEITNVKSRVNFSRKGINITSEVNIKAGANIPEVMERIQIEVRSRVQDMIGGEANLNMTVYVNKIVGEVPREMEPPMHEETGGGHVPYR